MEMQKRCIEFRVWCNGQLVKDLSEYTLEDLNGPCLEIEEYTGLRDKNGTKIFEGDIVLHDGLPGSKGLTVVFEDCGFMLKGKVPSDDVYIGRYSGLNMTVAGNIHDKETKA